MVGDQVLNQSTKMAEEAFTHFDALLGSTADPDCTLKPEQLIDPSADLAKLDELFTHAEI
jgi:hypothetical protein